MKKVIKASERTNDLADLRKVYKKAQALFNAMEETPAGFFSEYDLDVLYEELSDCLISLNYDIEKLQGTWDLN